MEYLKLLTKLAKTEKSYQYDEIIKLLKHPVEFEEIPLITRTGREKPFLKMLSPKQLNLFFLNTAIFYINNINLMAKDILIEIFHFLHLGLWISIPPKNNAVGTELKIRRPVGKISPIG